jgi:hypothetical protein
MDGKDDDARIAIARLEERMKAVEAKLGALDTRLWGAVFLIVAYVINKVMGLVTIGGIAP